MLRFRRRRCAGCKGGGGGGGSMGGGGANMKHKHTEIKIQNIREQ